MIAISSALNFIYEIFMKKLHPMHRNNLDASDATLSMEMIDCIEEFFCYHSHLILNEENFRSLFGVGLQTVMFSWLILKKLDMEKINPIHLLWTLYFLKFYPTSRNIWYFNVDRKTFKKIIWKVLAALYLYLETVRFKN
jgi:hypothetical protein